MSFVYCSVCNKFFKRENSDLCNECLAVENKNIDKITEYLKTFANAETHNLTIEILSQETGVNIQEIERLYRTDKLRGCISLFKMNCKICGKKFKPSIFTGYLCKSCSSKVEQIAEELKESSMEKLVNENQLSQLLKPSDTDKGMHYK